MNTITKYSPLDGITKSMDMSLSKLQETGRTGKSSVLQSIWSERVRHNRATEQRLPICQDSPFITFFPMQLVFHDPLFQ